MYRLVTWRCSLNIAAPSYFYIQREKTHNFSVVLKIVCGEFVALLFLLICTPTNHVFAEKIFVIQLFFKDSVSTFLNFLRAPVYFGNTLLNGCFQDVANAQAKNVVWKFALRKATYFCFCFLGKSILHHIIIILILLNLV